MNSTLKKFTAFVICTAMLVSLSACGNKNEDLADSTVSTGEITSAAEETASARVTVEGTKFMVNGKELWINGVNTPWQKWNDFGGNMDDKFWDDTFAQLKADGINCTRIWVNCAGENIIRLKSTGEIKEIAAVHWEELDRLFALAEKHEIYVMATLLSFDHFKDSHSGYEKWRLLLQSDELCDAYADTYVKEFCQRYGNNEHLFSIDIMNEPDWVKENPECGQIGWERLSYLFGKCAAVIHENCDVLVTVGTAMPKYNSEQWEGNLVSDEYLRELTGNENAYLDFYSSHYYSWMKQTFGIPFEKSPSDYGIEETKPNIIGEAGSGDEDVLGMSSAEKYKSSYENGWSGVMIWLEPKEEGGSYVWKSYDFAKEAAGEMAELIPEKIHPLD